MFSGRGELQGHEGEPKELPGCNGSDFPAGYPALSNGSENCQETEAREETKDREETVPGSPQV